MFIHSHDFHLAGDVVAIDVAIAEKLRHMSARRVMRVHADLGRFHAVIARMQEHTCLEFCGEKKKIRTRK